MKNRINVGEMKTIGLSILTVFAVESPPHHGAHPLTPANLEKHVPKPEAKAAAPAPAANTTGSIEMSQLPARYKRLPLTDVEMEAIEVRTNTNTRERKEERQMDILI